MGRYEAAAGALECGAGRRRRIVGCWIHVLLRSRRRCSFAARCQLELKGGCGGLYAKLHRCAAANGARLALFCSLPFAFVLKPVTGFFKSKPPVNTCPPLRPPWTRLQGHIRAAAAPPRDRAEALQGEALLLLAARFQLRIDLRDVSEPLCKGQLKTQR